MRVPLQFCALETDPRDARAVLVLVDATGRHFPLWLAEPQADVVRRAVAGASGVDGVTVLAQTLHALGAGVEHVELTGAVQRVLTAAVVIADAHGTVAIPARPSDAVALALRMRAPILVAEELLALVAARVADAYNKTGASKPPSVAAEPLAMSHAERWNALIEHLGVAQEPFEG